MSDVKSDAKPDVKLDRLSALMARFQLSATIVEVEKANLLVVDDLPAGGRCLRVMRRPLGANALRRSERPVLSVAFDWGGSNNPLVTALPDQVDLCLRDDPDLAQLIGLMASETDAGRCGAASVIDRLGEVLMVRVLRRLIEEGSTAPGLLGGLSDARISRVLVAIHEHPERDWTILDLADLAALSPSRFSEVFREVTGETPGGYLRRWRLTLARQDVDKGDRVQTVAARYGYGSGEALARAFRKAYGATPTGRATRAHLR